HATEDTTTAVVRLAAEQWPHVEAVVDGETRITFSELDEMVTHAARAVVATGLTRGERAAIWAPNCWQWIVAALGIHRAGGAVVPMTTRYKGDEAAYALTASGARLLFTVRGFLGIDYPALLGGHDTPVERTVVFGEPSWDELLHTTSAA